MRTIGFCADQGVNLIAGNRLAGVDFRPLGRPGERPQAFGADVIRPSIGSRCEKARRTRAGVSFSVGSGACQGRRC
jgi:hypothetical protein